MKYETAFKNRSWKFIQQRKRISLIIFILISLGENDYYTFLTFEVSKILSFTELIHLVILN